MNAGPVLWLTLAAGLAGCGGDEGAGPSQPATVITIVAGDSQIAGAGQIAGVDPQVRVEDRDGEPLVGVPVQFAVASGGGFLAKPDQVTDSSGLAAVGTWVLGSAGGTNTVTATAQGETVTFVAAGVADGVTAGMMHTCGIGTGGLAFCWGDNGFGQLGDNSRTARLTPVAVAGGHRFTALRAGGYHTCGITLDGATWCWGMNDEGELGDNTTTERLVPTKVVGGVRFASLTLGARLGLQPGHTCGINRSGVAYCWGDNHGAQLGDNSRTSRSMPTPVKGGLQFTALSTGADHTCGLTTGASIFCWGFNDRGRTGDTTTALFRTAPAPVVSGLQYTSVAAGRDHSCGLTTDQIIFCWGFNEFGQLGDGTTSGGPIPRRVDTGIFFLPFVAIAAGDIHTCGLINGGEAYCWGNNFHGQLGDNTGADRATPKAVAGGHLFTTLSPRGYQTCGLDAAGAAWCWGNNFAGQLGDGTQIDRKVPTAVAGGIRFLGRP